MPIIIFFELLQSYLMSYTINLAGSPNFLHLVSPAIPIVGNRLSMLRLQRQFFSYCPNLWDQTGAAFFGSC